MRLLLAAAALAAALLALPSVAAACGGCLGATITSVDSHRMAVLISPERSILWDQITYTGSPEDFVWVLPVPSANVLVELAAPSFLDDLEAQTSPIVQPRPPADPGEPEGCFGCCAGSAADSAAGDVPSDEVMVYATSTVGPYETVIIGAEDPDALQDWLAGHGYPVPESTVPTIDHYVERGSVFVALRLAPSAGVQAMQPVRVTYQGALAQFPLEMVTVGASGELGMTLWVIAEQRYAPRNYAAVQIDPDDLVFDWSTTTSNYDDVFDRTMQDAGGRAWVIEHAAPFGALWWSAAADADLVRGAIPAPFVTRLRTRMLVDHLDEDLELAPADDAAPVDRLLIAGQEVARPFDDAPPPEEDGCRVQRRASAHILTILLVAASCAWMARPRRRRRR
jgi:hypothetical protein